MASKLQNWVCVDERCADIGAAGEMPPGLNEEEALKWQMQARMGGADGVARMLVRMLVPVRCNRIGCFFAESPRVDP